MKLPRLLPPIWLAIALVLIVALHRWLPIATLIPAPWNRAGIAIALAGLALGGWSSSLFRVARTTIIPYQESSALILSGPYRFTRNPIYLSMTAMLLGVCVFLGSLAPFAVVAAFVAIIQTQTIVAEEAMLSEKFGAEYAAYRARVRRWL